jgi:hypothetical protein
MRESIRKALRGKDVTWSHNKSGYRGVCFSSRQAELGSNNVWKASIHRNDKSYHVGYYETPEKAYKMYKKAFSLPDSKFDEWFEELKEKRGNGQRGEKKASAKLINAQVKEMRKLFASGKHSQRALAKKFEIDPGHVSHIVRGTRRAHG